MVEYEPFRGLRMAVTLHSIDIQVGMERPAEMVPRDLGEVLMENKVARTYLRRADFERWGLSEGCPGCRYLRTGQGRQQAHSEACRRRIEGVLKGDSSGSARLAAPDDRINRALADAVERHAAKDWSERRTEEGQRRLSSRVRIPKENCTGHRARLDATPLSLIRRIISIRHETQHRHKDCTGRRYE